VKKTKQRLITLQDRSLKQKNRRKKVRNEDLTSTCDVSIFFV